MQFTYHLNFSKTLFQDQSTYQVLVYNVPTMERVTVV